MGLFILDYGAGNVQSLANTLQSLGHSFQWITSPADFDSATNLIFPGVGAFQTAVDGLISRGFLEPLRQYIISGRPYFGICIGMQVLFQSSTEGSTPGLGIIPSKIDLFSNEEKTVPHMGWNSPKAAKGLDEALHYYFVHSYRAIYDPDREPDAAQWVHSVTQYGQEVFVATVHKDNVFGSQFHPEKSGEAGLRLLDVWLRGSTSTTPRLSPAPHVPFLPRPRDGFTKRIIACMDVRANDQGDLVVTKGDRYDVREKATVSASPGSHSTTTTTTTIIFPSSPLAVVVAGVVRNLGKPVALAGRYYAAGADELALLNITSFRHSPLRDQPMLAVVRAAAAMVFVPLTIGGGIRDTVDPDGTPQSALEVAGAYFRAGADKVSIGSEAVYAVERLRATASGGGRGDGSSAIETIAHAYGRQAVVVSIDPRRVYIDDMATYDGPRRDELILGTGEEEGKVWWYQCTVSGGRETRDLSVVELARGVETLGAGEILLNSIDRDGTGLGFDLDLVNLVRKNVRIPVVASSGAGNVQHFVDVFEKTNVEAALAAGIFHRGEVEIDEVREALTKAGINARKRITKPVS
ncbi:imidazole glycerol phosphate synthase HisHF [Multifurca ochricompacta]|uniref:Imidazole glycerol phosphate synthase HisHF n=1 Tax=Multifurca ochricompacta TaxID=376703 RepID=A0AAD4MCK0_9AGAM|nr:imidazole glycerol phosphate synthase HisHF [Multifurca ochricompacta]